jgi:transposase
MRKQLTEMQRLIQSNTRLKNENAKLRKENTESKKRIEELLKIVETLILRIEELEKALFGSKHDKSDGGDIVLNSKKSKSKKKREKSSYNRSIPKESEITNSEYHSIKNCTNCNTLLKNIKVVTFHEETVDIGVKRIIEHKIEKGYCPHCRKYISAIPLPTSKVFLGNEVKLLVVYMTTIQRLSFRQIIEDLNNRYNFKISTGEIAKILANKAKFHSPDYERIKKHIQNQLVIHFDETSDKVRDGKLNKSYTWIMQAMDKPEVYFRFGQSRGGGVAKKMYKDSVACGVSDDYGVYKNLFKIHQLCWAHLHRKLRDLAVSQKLSDKSSLACKKTFNLESNIYKKVRELDNRYDLRENQRIYWYKTLEKKLQKLATLDKNEPKKLKTYKKTLSKNIAKYLTCIKYPGIPSDNNQAERSLRHVVLRRKNSFGSITDKGADTISILMSVFLTIRNRNINSNKTFFEAYCEFSV